MSGENIDTIFGGFTWLLLSDAMPVIVACLILAAAGLWLLISSRYSEDWECAFCSKMNSFHYVHCKSCGMEGFSE